MIEHWEAFGPPVYISVAAYLGATKKKGDKGRGAAGSSEEGDLGDLVAMLGGGGEISA